MHFMHYNYCRIHKTLRVTPAMAANLVASPWTVDDIVALVEKAENAVPKCSIPDDHIAPRRSALFMARWVLTEVRDGRVTC